MIFSKRIIYKKKNKKFRITRADWLLAQIQPQVDNSDKNKNGNSQENCHFAGSFGMSKFDTATFPP